jgi:hypothetical protein
LKRVVSKSLFKGSITQMLKLENDFGRKENDKAISTKSISTQILNKNFIKMNPIIYKVGYIS